MCEPISMTALMVGGQAASAIGAYQQQTAAHKWRAAVHKMNEGEALRAAGEQYAALGAQRRQMEQQAAQEGFEALRDLRLASKSATAGAAAAGVMGTSPDDIRATFAARYSEATGIRMKNLDASKQQIMRDMEAVRTATRGRIQQTLPGPRPRFNWLGLLGQSAGAAGGYLGSRPIPN